ncbi:hypothetical protein D3C81_750340 [compost metagenome]
MNDIPTQELTNFTQQCEIIDRSKAVLTNAPYKKSFGHTSLTINKKITVKPSWNANGMVIKTTKDRQPSLRKLDPRTYNSGHPMPGIFPDLQLLGTALQQGQAARSVIGGAAEQVEYQQLTQNLREARDE